MAGRLSLQEIFYTARFDGKGAIAGIKRFSKQLKGLNKPINSLNKSFSGLFKVAGIAGLTAMTLNAAKLGREMGLISRKTGIAVENISSMQNAFAASGGDAKEVSKTLDRITTGLARVAMGDASFTSSLASMGISAWENGRLKNAEKIRMDMADWIKGQLEAGRSLAQVATFMNETFGMSQAEVEHLSVGSKKLLEIQKKYNGEIGVLSKEESQALDDINNSVARLRATVGVTFDKIISETAPMLETILSSIQNMVKVVQEHKDLFGPLLAGLAGLSVILKALPALFTAISAHPLVALALASVAAGYAIGGGFSDPKTVKENVEDLLLEDNKNLDIGGAYVRGFISDYKLNLMHAQGKISDEEYTKALMAKAKNSSTTLDIYEKIPSIVNEEGNLVDLSKVPYIDSPGNKTINVEINTTNNIDGDLEEGDVVYLSDKQGHVYANYVVNAADGAMGMGD